MGCKETLRVGDLHWLTTGGALLHAQVPGPAPRNRHVQFWINLPRAVKYGPARNQFLRAPDAPTIAVASADGRATARLLAGSYKGKQSPIETHSPLLLMDVTATAAIALDGLPSAFRLVTYVISGTGVIGGVAVQERSMCAFDPASTDAAPTTAITVEGGEGGAPLRFLLFGGEPIDEPIDVDGFFVCTSPKETAAVVADFEGGSNAFAPGRDWASHIAN